MVLIRQWRYGIQASTLEIPGGMVDPGESPAAAAARELREETGYAPDGVSELGTVNPNPALFGNRLHTFLARGARPVAPICNEGTEETVVELVAEGELRRLVRGGTVDHALVVSALHLLDLAREAAP